MNYSAWIPNTDLTPLDPETCKDVPEKGKQKQLLAAYKVAAENHDLQHFKSLLADHQRAIQQEAEDREAKEAAKAAAKAEKEQKKKKRKSVEVAGEAEDVEMGEAEEEEGKKTTKATKKRKKDAESEGEAEKVSVSAAAVRGSLIPWRGIADTSGTRPSQAACENTKDDHQAQAHYAENSYN